jgi:phage FluMu protein gp41
MRTVKVILHDGLKIGEETMTEATLRETTAADVIEAIEESERLLNLPDGPALVASPTMVGMHTLRRQIVSIGSHPGPLLLSELKKLSAIDLGLLQEQAMDLERASMKGLADRGRHDAGAEGAD